MTRYTVARVVAGFSLFILPALWFVPFTLGPWPSRWMALLTATALAAYWSLGVLDREGRA